MKPATMYAVDETPLNSVELSRIDASWRVARLSVGHGSGDQPHEWLHTGEALSAGWLTATERGIGVLPLSAPFELTATREVMRQLVPRLGYPYLVLRLGVADPGDPAAPHSPLLTAAQIGGSHARQSSAVDAG